MKLSTWGFFVLTICFVFVAVNHVEGANTFVQGLAPDWNQPYAYPDAFDASGPGPDPNPGVAGDPWDAWCTPTAAACTMGHWADVRGYAKTGDASADGNQGAGAYGGNGWPAADWHDYTADGANRPGPGPNPPGPGNATDLGWYMNTNNLGDNNLVTNPGVAHVGTYVGNTAEGVNNFLADRQSSLAGSVATSYVAADGSNLQQIVNQIVSEVDHNRTVLGHFRFWVNPGSGNTGNGAGGEAGEGDFLSPGDDPYEFSDSQGIPDNEQFNNQFGEEGLGHTVCIVGYTTGVGGAVTHFFAHDNWSATGRNVQVSTQGPFPLTAVTSVVPEPFVLLHMIAAVAMMLLYGRHC